MGKKIFWNRDWVFIEEYSDAWMKNRAIDTDERVQIPHTVKVTPFHYFDEEIYQKVCGYKKIFVPEETWKGKRVSIHIGAAAHSAWVYLNGELLGEHHCGYTEFEVALENFLLFGQENTLVIKVDSREQQNIPPFGHVVDYMTYGGIYRDIYLEINEPVYIQDVYVKTKQKEIFSEVTIKNKDNAKVTICQSLLSADKEFITEFCAGSLMHNVPNALLWSVEEPNLYILRTKLFKDEELIDTKDVRFGFRDIEFKADGFYLNGTKVKLRGLNRHQSYPYVGYAMPKSVQKQDAKILKEELGVNAVRTSHYPQSQDFVDSCDELGLLVFTEIPGWQYVGNESWKEQAILNTEEMVLQYRNHPSIILWGVRINESQDFDDFYAKTNEKAHSLDDRPTSGVRFLQKSSLLEDVYAYNDFSHEGTNAGCQKKKQNTPDRGKGYFISEYNGHMYPTKTFDAEDHRVEHMLRHARVMNAYYGEEDIAGGFGWCMFDYNTHRDFGSGDRICYHGVMDMFRNPKLAASVYACQSEERNVLEISSSMDIGEHPACLMKDVYAITNADSVRVYKNDTFVREFTNKETPFQNLPHGPILLDDFIGNQMELGEGFSKSKSDDVKKILMSACRNGMSNLPFSTLLLAAKCVLFRGMKMQDAVELYNKYIGNWGGTATTYRFEAVKDGKVVSTVVKKTMKKAHLWVSCSHQELCEEETYDVASIRIQVRDEEEQVLSFSNMPLQLRVEGPVELIGPDLISLQGGMGGTYIKTTGEVGDAKLMIKGDTLETVIIPFTVKNGE